MYHHNPHCQYYLPHHCDQHQPQEFLVGGRNTYEVRDLEVELLPWLPVLRKSWYSAHSVWHQSVPKPATDHHVERLLVWPLIWPQLWDHPDSPFPHSDGSSSAAPVVAVPLAHVRCRSEVAGAVVLVVYFVVEI